MFDEKFLFYFIFLQLILVHSQFHLHYTNFVDESAKLLQHDCLRIAFDLKNWKEYHKILYFCLSELPSTFHINENEFVQKYTFAQLAKQNITSQQLFHWSTPIDLIEDYQLYLNDLLLENQIFYNCTLPRFGSKCQYELINYNLDQSLNEFISDYYDHLFRFHSESTSITCYMHLKCNRGVSSICLDWTEICDGRIDCLDDAIDEENCWQLKTNECQDHEYRCRNGQCIPKSFYKDKYITFDCIDRSDEIFLYTYPIRHYDEYKKTVLAHEDIVCQNTAFTSSCDIYRFQFLISRLSSTKISDISEECWSALKCVLNGLDRSYLSCDDFCERFTCTNIMKNTCPDLIFFPNAPISFGDFYLALITNDLYYETRFYSVSFQLCFNNSHYDHYFLGEEKRVVNNMTCVKRYRNPGGKVGPPLSIHELYSSTVILVILELKRYHQIYNASSAICNASNMYRCNGSWKYISIYSIENGDIDCPYGDDENFNMSSNFTWLDRLKKTLFKCELSNKYISYHWVQNGVCNCPLTTGVCEDEHFDLAYVGKNVLFQHICDGFVDLLLPKNESDETECQHWECTNIYTQRDGIWNCPDGIDETDYFLDSTLCCSSDHQLCVSPQTNQFFCLSMDKVNDSIVDCLGATDEPTFMCPKGGFYCRNQPSQSCILIEYLCSGQKNCEHGDDEQFCETKISSTEGRLCGSYFNGRRTNMEHYFCSSNRNFEKRTMKHFTIDKMITSVQAQTMNTENAMIFQSPVQSQSRCHRGLDLRVWLDPTKNITRNTCLCLPSYYGNECQYQNQRIHLILKFEALSDSLRTLFAIVIQLIDDSDDRIIHSYEQLTYLSIRDCQTKFNIYLLYSTRPKNVTKQYAIHLDIYEKETFVYRGSLVFATEFSFLPVHHLPLIIQIPRNDDKIRYCFNSECVHGKCMKYFDSRENLTFCQCKQGWTGKYCRIRYSCRCSSDSLCVGIDSMNRSICICPLRKFGPRCLLTHQQRAICEGEGQYLVNDDYLMSNQSFSCICPKNLTGHRCQIAETKLVISFNKTIPLSEHMFIHFIEINPNVIEFESIVRSTTFRTISSEREFFTVYWSQVFHLVFIELFNKTYYLTLDTSVRSIHKTIQPSDRCLNIVEIFNQSFAQFDLLRRIKFYHLPCQNQSLNLSCFYDEVHLCLCYQFGHKRLANCFRFDHNKTYDCQGQNECENDGQCLQDHPTCPTKSLCICQPCVYGRRCQFNTNEFGLSLDSILGYHIRPNIGFSHQSTIVKFSFGLTIILILFGLLNGIFCLITFKNKTICEVGCGLYLLGSSITSILTMIMFGLKYFLLLLTQMNMITNRIFLTSQCYVLDYFLRVFLSMDQWLNACVAAERTMTAIQGATFVKKKSRKIAIRVILILILIVTATCIHDALFRQVIDEINYNGNDNENHINKIWCIVKYNSALHIYNNVIHAFHFTVPFLINLLSAIILIKTKVHQQLTIQHKSTYRQILWKELKKHKHLIIAPLVLVILGIPRLIFAYVSKCMNSLTNTWIFFLGYCFSFIPSMVTFIVFISPSEFYKKEFEKSMKQYRTFLTKLLHL